MLLKKGFVYKIVKFTGFKKEKPTAKVNNNNKDGIYYNNYIVIKQY